MIYLLISLWIFLLRCLEKHLLHTEKKLHRGEIGQGGLHLGAEEIRITKELLKRRWEYLKLSWEAVSLYVERQMLVHPTLNIDLPDPPHRVRGNDRTDVMTAR